MFLGKLERKGRTSSSGCAGIVTKVGNGVTAFKSGDRVVVMAPGHFSTIETFPEWTCEKLRDTEDFNVVSTIPTAFATAMYALNDCASLRPKETILINSGASDVGIAAIQLAQLKGAEVFTTVNSDEDQEFLIKNYAVQQENIFQLRGSNFLPAIRAATKGRGVDFVLNSLPGDQLDDSLRCCARFGRFVEIGKHDITDLIKLDIQRNITFTAFDLSELYDSTDSGLIRTWQRYVLECGQDISMMLIKNPGFYRKSWCCFAAAAFELSIP